jgi:branched-subunit amino acid aminotransferase/4-amino-4-deoxychorismate lyase
MTARASHARTPPAGRIAYVDGRYIPHRAASVHIEDRGLQFADSVYEVCAVIDGCLMDEEGHLDRLARSLAALDMPMPMARIAWWLWRRATGLLGYSAWLWTSAPPP